MIRKFIGAVRRYLKGRKKLSKIDQEDELAGRYFYDEESRTSNPTNARRMLLRAVAANTALAKKSTALIIACDSHEARECMDSLTAIIKNVFPYHKVHLNLDEVILFPDTENEKRFRVTVPGRNWNGMELEWVGITSKTVLSDEDRINISVAVERGKV